MTIPSFAPSAYTNLDATSASSTVTLPTTGSPTVALVTNVGPTIVFVTLGSGSATVAPNAGVPVVPMSQVALTIGANTTLAAITDAGTAALVIAVGS